MPNQVKVDSLLQILDTRITTSHQTAIDSIPSHELVIPKQLLLNMIIALQSSKDVLVNEKF
jgi:hypothetical protein